MKKLIITLALLTPVAVQADTWTITWLRIAEAFFVSIFGTDYYMTFSFLSESPFLLKYG